MTNIPILDLIAGMIFIYFLLSLVNNSLVELIFSLTRTRANLLQKWIVLTFTNGEYKNSAIRIFSKLPHTEFTQNLVNHPLLNGLSSIGKSTAYMDSKKFASALLQIISDNIPLVSSGNMPLSNIQAAIYGNTYLPETIKQTLLYFTSKTEIELAINEKLNVLEHIENQIANWFDDSMQRISGQLKKWSQLITFLVACCTAIVFNVDSISIAKYLYNNPEANKQLAMVAYKEANDSAYYKSFEQLSISIQDTTMEANDSMALAHIKENVQKTKANMDSVVSTLSLSIPIGWNANEKKVFANCDAATLTKIGGFLVTIFAICLGAPFWFDVLGKIANLRSSLKPLTNEEKKKIK